MKKIIDRKFCVAPMMGYTTPYARNLYRILSKNTLETHGYGMSSVRFICGTQDIHKNLEDRLSNFLGM